MNELKLNSPDGDIGAPVAGKSVESERPPQYPNQEGESLDWLYGSAGRHPREVLFTWQYFRLGHLG